MQTKNIALVLSLSLFLVTSGSVYYIYVCVLYTIDYIVYTCWFLGFVKTEEHRGTHRCFLFRCFRALPHLHNFLQASRRSSMASGLKGCQRAFRPQRGVCVCFSAVVYDPFGGSAAHLVTCSHFMRPKCGGHPLAHWTRPFFFRPWSADLAWWLSLSSFILFTPIFSKPRRTEHTTRTPNLRAPRKPPNTQTAGAGPVLHPRSCRWPAPNPHLVGSRWSELSYTLHRCKFTPPTIPVT